MPYRCSRWESHVGTAIVLLLVVSVTPIGFASPPSPQPQETQTDVQGIPIELRAGGFEPTDLNLNEGQYLFLVFNHSGIRNLTFRIQAGTGEIIYEVQSQQPQWRKKIDLKAGKYILLVADYKDWACPITVNSL